MNYIFKNNVLLLILLAVLFAGCGYKQTNTQTRDIGFLKFNKSINKSYTVVINDKSQFILNACTLNHNTNQCNDDTKDTLYEIESGNILIEVFQNKILILKEQLYLGSSNTKEINLP